MPAMKAVILIAGPQKGTRFRPLSLDLPKPLFPLAGMPMIAHHVEAAAAVPGVNEVLILGSYPNADLAPFVQRMSEEHPRLTVRYLQEYTSLGTAGGIYHFRDRILAGDPDSFFVMNGDVCAQFPLQEMVDFAAESDCVVTMMATEATRQQSLNYGCVVEDPADHTVLHYVEKPETHVSTSINCGVYIFNKEVFPMLKEVFKKKQASAEGTDIEAMWIEKDILPALAGTGRARVYHTKNWWSQVKTAGAAIYANRHYLELFKRTRPERLARDDGEKGPKILENVFIHHGAKIHPEAVLGPNVSVGKNVVVGAGTRIRESVILSNSVIGHNSLIMHAVIGSDASVGDWARIEGTPNDPNPDKPFAKMESPGLFNQEGRLNPAVTILGCGVVVPSEVVVLNSIVLPHKQITQKLKNEIIL